MSRIGFSNIVVGLQCANANCPTALVSNARTLRYPHLRVAQQQLKAQKPGNLTPRRNNQKKIRNGDSSETWGIKVNRRICVGFAPLSSVRDLWPSKKAQDIGFFAFSQFLIAQRMRPYTVEEDWIFGPRWGPVLGPCIHSEPANEGMNG